GSSGGPVPCTPPDSRVPGAAVGAPQVSRSGHFPLTRRAGPDGGSAGLPPCSAAPAGVLSKAALPNWPFDAGFTRGGGSRIAGRSSPANMLVSSGGGGGGDLAPSIGSVGDGRGCGDGGGCGGADAAGYELTGSDGQLLMHAQRSSQALPPFPPPPSSETVLTLLAETLPALAFTNARRKGTPKPPSPQPQAHNPASKQEEGHTAAAAEVVATDGDTSTHRSPGARSSANCHSP
ncbi:hypothetical protein Vafri_12752, partial [Volvox africanus]